ANIVPQARDEVNTGTTKNKSLDPADKGLPCGCGSPALLYKATGGHKSWSYRRILVTEGSGGSGLSLRSDNLDSVGELYTEDDFRQLVVAIESTPVFLGSLGELEDHGERGLVRETSLGAHRAVADCRERAFDDVRRAQMLPVLGRGVVEGELHVAIIDQALGRLVIFDVPGLDEGVEGRKRILLGLGHPDFLQRPLGFRLLALRQFVEDVGGFVHPPALAARLGPDLFDRLPES